MLLDELEGIDGFGILAQLVLRHTQHIHVAAQRCLFLLGSRFAVEHEVVDRFAVVPATEVYLAQHTVQLTVVQALGLFAEQGLGACLHFVVLALGVVDLHEVVGYRLLVLCHVLQLQQGRQRFVVLLLLVHAVGVVVRRTRGITIVVLAELPEIDRGALVLLLHEVGIAAVERVVVAMVAAQRLDVDRLQDFKRLFVVPFLHLQNALHQFHLVFEGGVGIGLQVGLQVILQLFVSSVKPGYQSQVVGLHRRRLGVERGVQRTEYRKTYYEKRFSHLASLISFHISSNISCASPASCISAQRRIVLRSG